MSITSLTAVPAATKVARDVMAGTAQVGHNFFSFLSQLTAPGNSSEGNTSIASSDTNSTTPSSDTLSQRTSSFSQRLAAWLRQQPWVSNANATDQTSIELSLDQLDRPQATLNGQSSPELDAAFASNPSWLEQFRDLALDRLEQMGAAATGTPLQSLTIQSDSVTMNAQHRWN